MTVMRNVELYPNGDPIVNKKVLFKMWAAPAYSPEGEFSLEAVGEVKTDNDGYWEAELEPTIGLLPTGNVYLAEIVFRGGVIRHLFEVPEVAPEWGEEPYWIGDHLADPPGALMTAALADHILDPNAHNETVHPDLAVHDALGLATDAALAAEAVLRANADTGLNTRVASIEALGPLATDAEVATAVAAAVAAEAATRLAADNALDARLDVVEAGGPLATDAEVAAAVAAEAALRIAADTSLAGRLDTIEALGSLATDAELANEATTRFNADAALDTRLDAIEALGPLASDAEVSAAVASEATIRASADTSLDARLDTIEGLGPLATDAELASAIATEATARAAGDDELGDRLGVFEALGPLATDAELAAEATTRSQADAALDVRLDAIEALGGLASDAELANEASIRAAADLALDGRLDSIEGLGALATDAELAAAVAVLDDDISGVFNAMVAADTALDARLGAIEALGPLATDAEVAALAANVVLLTGNQTIAGTKTFQGSVLIVGHSAMGTGTVDQVWFGYPTKSLMNMRETFTGDFNSDQRVAQALEATFNPTVHGYPTGEGYTSSWAQISVARTDPACDKDVYEMNAGFFAARHEGTGTVAMLAGIEGRAFIIGAGNAQFAYGVWSALVLSGSGDIGDGYGFHVDRPLSFGGGTITNSYGLHIADHSATGVTRSENIRSEGVNSVNVFEGQIQAQNKVTVQQATANSAQFDLKDSTGVVVAQIRGLSGANFGLGANTLDSVTTGTYNVGIGSDVLTANTSGYLNVGIGLNSLAANTLGFHNTGVGANTLRHLTGDPGALPGTTSTNNTAIGANSMEELTSGHRNAAFGVDSLWKETTGSYNTAGGVHALNSQVGVDGSTGFGYYALYANIAGIGNTAIGQQALGATTVGFGTAVGQYAAGAVTTGAYNTAVGNSAMFSPNAAFANRTIAGGWQTAIGALSGQANATTCDYGTALGYAAIYGATAAVALGPHAQALHVISVALGYGSVTTRDNQVMIGDRDLEITDPTKGLVGESPDGTKWRLVFGNDGAVETAVVA